MIIAAAVFVAVVLTVVLWPQEKEPEYQGRKLSEWIGADQVVTASYIKLGAIAVPFPGGVNVLSRNQREGDGAVRYMGTNGLH